MGSAEPKPGPGPGPHLVMRDPVLEGGMQPRARRAEQEREARAAVREAELHRAVLVGARLRSGEGGRSVGTGGGGAARAAAAAARAAAARAKLTLAA